VSEGLSIALLSHIASREAPTGAEHSLALLARGLSQRGHRVTVVAPGPWALADSLARDGVAVATVASKPCWLAYWEPRPWPVALAKWLRYAWPPRGRRALAAWLARSRPDAVHVNCLPHLAGASAAAKAGRPVAWHVREIVPAGRRRRWLAAQLRRDARAIVAVSEAVARWLRDENLGDRLHVVPNGVESCAPPPDPWRARSTFGLERERVVIGLFGQLVPHKGALSFIEAARRALAEQRDLCFVLAGPGPAAFRRRCEQAIARGSLADSIRLLPAQPAGGELIVASDVVCLATETPDPLPRAVLEAMAAGRPVAAFDSGGTGEMVAHGETGLLVAPGDVDGLARAFLRLGRDRALRDRLGQAGARRVRESFSFDLHVSRMEAVIAGVACGAEGRRP